MTVFLVITIAIVLILFGAVHVSGVKRFEQFVARKAALHQWAESKGFKMLDPPSPKATVWRHRKAYLGRSFYKQFGPGYPFNYLNAKVKNVIEGITDGVSFTLFDLDSHEGQTNTHEFSVIVINTPMLIPSFTIRPHRRGDKLLSFFRKKQTPIGDARVDKYICLDMPDHQFAMEKLGEEFFTEVLQSRTPLWYSNGRRIVLVRSGWASEIDFEIILDAATRAANILMSRPFEDLSSIDEQPVEHPS